ncbi:MAG: 30S ribosomal protein S12 methylthiotransferase RimO [Rikenellaceae bacterium]|jgi:ribosomal protein S12 methylthiotransferase|nr:30S ribosomal protein S12 methylthiotransferase RimO [Rikenellaceae bacterium]
MKKKVNIVTLGCSKNLVDSEHLAARFAEAGYGVVFDSGDTAAKTVVINTCGFIGDAKEESVNTILEFARAREAGDIERLFVIGCLSERYADELRVEIPEVDEYFGARNFEGVIERLEASLAPEFDTQRVLSTPRHYAYLKISEGCDRRCGFCAIPLIRGDHRSVPMEQLVEEAERLAKQGVRELIVIAQDTTYYGLDLYGERRLGELLRRLCRIEGIEWVRLHYAYPASFPADVIEAMRDEPKICKYIDIPLQHISDSQLRSMKRGLGSAGTRELIARLRDEIPGVAIRTTMLVGYPNETEADFNELLDFVREARFERLGVFPYSEEEGTYSAEELTDDVPEEVKQERVERLMEVQAAVSAELNQRRVGGTERVIVDGKEGDVWVCRSQWDSPEVDTEILVTSARELKVGEFVTVRITTASEYDLAGEIL